MTNPTTNPALTDEEVSALMRSLGFPLGTIWDRRTQNIRREERYPDTHRAVRKAATALGYKTLSVTRGSYTMVGNGVTITSSKGPTLWRTVVTMGETVK